VVVEHKVMNTDIVHENSECDVNALDFINPMIAEEVKRKRKYSA